MTTAAFATIVTLGLGLGLTTSPALARPLLNELSILLSTHPALEAGLLEANARREEIGVAQSGLLPYVQSTGESGFERTDQPINDQIRNQIGLTVTQNLYDGYGTTNRIRASELNERIGHSDLRSIEDALLLDGIQSYIDVVLQNKLVEISTRHVEIVQEITDYIATERDAGRMTLADSLQSRARLQQSRETLISYSGGRRNSVTRYQSLFGQAPSFSAMDDPVAPMAVIPATLEECLNYALDNNSALETARLNIDMAGAQRLASGATSLPQIDLEGSVDFKNDYDGATGNQEEGTLLVKLSWDLFDGYRTSATEMAAAQRESAALATLRQRELEVTEQVRMAWDSMMTERERMQALGEAQSIAKEAYNARYSLMDTGKETIINVLDTALEVLNVRLALTTVDYRYRLAAYRLLHAMGRLNPGTINSVISVKPIDMSAINAIAPTRLNATDLMQTPVGASNSASPVSMEDLMALPVPTVQPAVPTSLAASAMAQGATQMVTQAATVIMEPGTGYLVVLSSNRDQRNARMTLEKLNLQGANIETLDVNGKPMYMVTIGPLPEPEARLVQGEAFDAGVLDAWLKKL